MVSPVTNFFWTAHRVYNNFSRDCGGKRIVAVARRKHIFISKMQNDNNERDGCNSGGDVVNAVRSNGDSVSVTPAIK